MALGWIGWTPEQAMFTDVNAILVAVEGRKDMLRYIFGDGKPSPGEAPRPATKRLVPIKQLTPDQFDNMF